MKKLIITGTLLFLGLASFTLIPLQKKQPFFNGKNFDGFDGDTVNTWHIKDGAIVGGRLDKYLPENEFLSTTRSYKNFRMRLKTKLLGTGFVNGGVQFHSQRTDNPPNEMVGYQADLGDGWWGGLYDESRRNKVLIAADTNLIKKIVKPNDWNDYEVRAENGRIRIWLNGKLTIDYTENDPNIPQSGRIAFQAHGGGNVEIYYKNIRIEELP
jgi:hypothetical protein